jgi:hypothetical protein
LQLNIYHIISYKRCTDIKTSFHLKTILSQKIVSFLINLLEIRQIKEGQRNIYLHIRTFVVVRRNNLMTQYLRCYVRTIHIKANEVKEIAKNILRNRCKHNPTFYSPVNWYDSRAVIVMFYIVMSPQHAKVKNSLEQLLYTRSLLLFHTITFSASGAFRMYKNSQAFQRGRYFPHPSRPEPRPNLPLL